VPRAACSRFVKPALRLTKSTSHASATPSPSYLSSCHCHQSLSPPTILILSPLLPHPFCHPPSPFNHLPSLADAIRVCHPKTVKTNITHQCLSPRRQLAPCVLLDSDSIYSSFGLCPRMLVFPLCLRPLSSSSVSLSSLASILIHIQTMRPPLRFSPLTHAPAVTP
jgi:hypothetical protein